MNTLLITGVAGELGIVLCNHFLNHGMDVYGIDHVERDGHLGLDLIGRNALFHFKNQPIKEVDLGELEEIDCIFHLAQNPPKINQFSDLRRILHDQQQNMKHLIKYAGKHHIKIFLISTIEVYGNSPELSDDRSTSPTSLYGTLMLSEETFLEELAEENGVDYQILRIPNVEGCSNPIENFCHKIDQQEKAGVSNQNREFNNKFTITKEKLITTCNQLVKGELSEKIITSYEKK